MLNAFFRSMIQLPPICKHCSKHFLKLSSKYKKTFDQLRRYLVAAVFCQRRVLRFPAGLLAGYPFCSVCGVVSFVSGIRVLGLGPFPF